MHAHLPSLVLVALEDVETPDVAVGEAGDEGTAHGGGAVGGQDSGIVGVQDFVALEGAQQRGPDAQEGCLPCGRRAGAVDDAVEDCGGHERAWDGVRRGLGGEREGRVTVEESCVVAHGG